MKENVEKFFALYNSDPGLKKRVKDAEAAYPGSLELREPLVEAVLLPVARELGLKDVTCLHARAEEQALVKGYRDSFDLVTARAVADLRLLSELCLPYAKVGGTFLSMKSVDSGEELDRAAHAIKLLGGRLENITDCPIPGCDVTHRVVAIRKMAPTLKGYPRRWAKIQKEPL